MQKLFRSLIAVGGLAGLVACGDDVSVTEPPPPAFAISGAPVTAVQVGAKIQLSATEAATWASSAANVATVDGNGLVTAVAAGTASITATSTVDVSRHASVTITVTAPAVRSVTVSPSNAILKPGDTQGFSANVDADAGVARTVTWTSSNNAVATVSTAGVVTAVTVGNATITAASTVTPAVTGTAAITVRAPVQAAISISNITVTGTPGNTVNVNNVAGSIDVNMNVDPGEQVVTRAEVLIDGNVACSQNLSGAQSEALRLAAAFDDLESVIVSCQINTAAFSATTGVANFANGSHTIAARAIIAGGTQTATPSTQLTFNNTSGVIVTLTTGAPVINPGTGFAWIGGGVTLNVVGVSYVAGTTISSVTCSIFGKTPVIALTAGTGSVAWTKTTTNWSGTNSALNGYLSAGAESVSCPSAVLSNGQPLVPAPGTTPVLNFGAPGMNNAAMPALQVVRLDNVVPGANSVNGPTQAPIVVVAMTLPWVNATSTLTPSATGAGTNVLGLPSLATLNAATAGVDIEEGADAIVVTVNVPAAGGALPTTGGSCNITGLTAVTLGSQLAETTVSAAYPARITFTDGLGNQFCMDLVQSFGADFTAPTATITGPVPNTGYNAAPPSWATTASDNASGFSATPLRVNMSRLNVAGTTSCVINTGASSCTGGSTAQQPLTFSATGGSGTEGYYTTSITISDAAGNTAVLVTSQVNGFDVTLPTFSGGISLPAVIAGAATNTFTTTVADNLDLGSIFGLVAYPVGANIQYPTQTIGTFGPALEQTSTNFGYAVSNWIRCLNAAGSFAVASGQPTGITLTVTDITTLPSTNTATLASAAFGANAQACTGTGIQGAVGNITGINFFNDQAPNYGGTNTQVDLDGATVAVGSSTSVTLTTVADVLLNSSADPFTRVDYYYVNTSGNLVKIGTATAVLAQTQTNRTYTYSFVWDPAAPVQTGAVQVVSIGVDAQGDAVFGSGGIVVTIVP
jgi:hypothetical protein